MDISLAYSGSAGHLGVCLQDDGCSVLAQDCPAESTCAPVGYVGPLSTRDPALQCVPSPGNGALGEYCGGADNGDCEAGLFCPTGNGLAPMHHPLSGTPITTCTRFCDPDVSLGNSACDPDAFGPNQACVDVSLQLGFAEQSVGLCVR